MSDMFISVFVAGAIFYTIGLVVGWSFRREYQIKGKTPKRSIMDEIRELYNA